MHAQVRLIIIGILLLSLGACTNFVPWTAVRSDAAAIHSVERDGVVVAVEEFGVLDGWGKPTAKVRFFNGGQKPVTVDLAQTRLDVDGTQFPPNITAGESSTITLAPGETHEAKLTFETTLPIQRRDGTDANDMQVLTQEMHLHLAPLVIDGAETPLPALVYRNPDP